MTEWIRKQINPVGTEKKNRGSLFALTARVFELVKQDALTAFNAHFPYLANVGKLAEHGKALSVPRLEGDTDEAFRNRVSAASFYLIKSGERAYTLQQLDERFGDNYTLKEEFLKIAIKITELNDQDRAWVREFFDSTFDPNISFSVAEWFAFRESAELKEQLSIAETHDFKDMFFKGVLYDGSHNFDGTWLYGDDGGIYDLFSMRFAESFTELVRAPITYNGSFRYNGAVTYSGLHDNFALEDSQIKIVLDFRDINPAPREKFWIGITKNHLDIAQSGRLYNGRLKYNGEFNFDAAHDEFDCRIDDAKLSDAIGSNDEFQIMKTAHHYYDGKYTYNGEIKFDSDTPTPVT
jgi:hypothetical protein